MGNSEFIPVCEPLLDGNEEKYVVQALRNGWISSSGAFVSEFEERFAAYCGRRFGLTTTSGTTSLHLALLAAGVTSGHEVILPDFTMVSTLFAVLYCGARPVFVDVDEDTWNLNPTDIEKKITRRTKVILPAHIFGHPAEMTSILDVAKQHGLAVVEDAAQAHGARYEGQKCGGMGEIGCFSFFANKLITTGEGGMLVTDDEELYDRARYYRNLCFDLNAPRDYQHRDLGYNFRFTNLQAAVGLGQLESIDRYLGMRRATAHRYNEALRDVPGVRVPIEQPGCKSAYWMYAITIAPAVFGMTRDTLMAELKEKGIDSRMLFKPMHSQPVLQARGLADPKPYPVTERLAETGLYLPTSTSLRAEQVAYICEMVGSLGKGR